ncbi:MAG: VOC family protein [Saprospiraceae bacterium]|nr:VOC family protein [Saprospiraceae bacterium]
MEQRLSFITLGVQDLDRMKRWYTEVFGWTPLKNSDGIVFFRLNGCILGLFPAHELAEDIGVPAAGQGFKRFTLAVCYRSEEAVDAVFAALRQKGARIVLEPERVFWGGYRGYIADLEDNYWEIACNPFLDLDAEGNVMTHR